MTGMTRSSSAARRRALLALGVLVALALTACGGGGGGGGADDADVGATGTWKDMAAAPIAGRSPAARAWTGKELVVWGGGFCKANPCQFDNVEPLADGAAYDPAADTWRKIA